MTGLASGLEIVVVVVVALAVWATLMAGVGVAAASRRLRRPILLHPGDRIPLRWRWSPEPAAVLHRRLLSAVGRVRLSQPGGWPAPEALAGADGGLLAGWRRGRLLRRQERDRDAWPAWVAPVRDLEGLAAAVDARLVAAGSQPRGVRHLVMADLATEVATVEGVARRLVRTLREWEVSVEAGGLDAGPGPGLGPVAAAVGRDGARIARELDALDAALAELRRRE